MKGRIRIELLTGVIFISAMIVLGYYTILVSKQAFSKDDVFKMTVYFSDVSGLRENHKVMVNGVYSGAVENVKLNENLAEVTIVMFNHFKIYSNYRVFITGESAIGGKQIRIYPGSGTDELGNFYDQISLEQPLTGVLRDPLETLNILLDENREDIRIAVRNIRGFSEKLNSNNGTLSKLLTEDKLAGQASDLLEQLKDTIEDAREQAPVTSFIRAALTAF